MGIYCQTFSCCCSNLDGNIQDCKHNTVSNIFTSEVSVIQQKWHIFQEKGRNNKAEDAKPEYDEFDVFECDGNYVEGEVYEMLHNGDIAVIRSGDEYHPFYLLKLTHSRHLMTTDNYKHTFPKQHRVFQGNYFESFKEARNGEIYYLDTKYTAIISSLCVVGTCPELNAIKQRRKGNDKEMFFVSFDLQNALCELVSQ